MPKISASKYNKNSSVDKELDSSVADETIVENTGEETEHDLLGKLELSPYEVSKLTKDLKLAARMASPREIRFLVAMYITLQKQRIRTNNQSRAAERLNEPNAAIDWFCEQFKGLEDRMRGVLNEYTKNHKVGRWLHEVDGIGPVIASGLLAHIDIHKAPVVSHIWNFAGLNPTVRWEKGQKRPWNARLKTLCHIAGECFTKISYKDSAYYGHAYKYRKEVEWSNNLSGKYSEQAKDMLQRFSFSEDTQAIQWYSGEFSTAYLDTKSTPNKWVGVKRGTGIPMLPPAHINKRAQRWAVKLFLSHLHHVSYVAEFGTIPPLPYAIAILGHSEYLGIPYCEDIDYLEPFARYNSANFFDRKRVLRPHIIVEP